MSKPVFVVWSLAWTVLTGVLITVALLVPGAQPRLGLWIVVAAAVSALVAIPFSVSVAKAFRE